MNLFNNEFRSGSHAAFVFTQFNTTFPIGQSGEGYARNVNIQQGLTYRLTYFVKRTAKGPAYPLGINTSQWIATNIGINGNCVNVDNTYLVPPILNSHQIVHTATHVLDQWVMNQVIFTAQGNFNQLWFRTKEDPDPANPRNVCSYLFVDDVTLELLPIDNCICTIGQNCTQIGTNGSTKLVFDGTNTLPNFTLGCYNICGTLDVNQDFSMFSTTVNMSPGAKILVRSGKTLNLIVTNLIGCNTMWQGIELESGANINWVGGSIQDAQYGINCIGQTNISYGVGCNFKNCYVGIHSPPSIFKIINTPIFSENVFDFTGFKPFFAGQNPTPQSRTFAGIEINNSVMILNSGVNIFNDLQNGIVARSCGIKVNNCEFNRIGNVSLPFTFCNPEYLYSSPDAFAIYGLNSLLFAEENKINIARGGIIANNCYMDVRNNNPINQCIDGIASVNCNWGYQIIDNNEIHNFGVRGISILTPISVMPVITNNKLSSPSLRPRTDNCEGIVGIYLKHSHGEGQIENNNPIDITGDARGIWLRNSANNGLQANIVNITTAKLASAWGFGGIIADYSDNNRFYSNIVEGFNTEAHVAFSLTSGKGNKYCCNSSNNTYAGFSMGGFSNPTELRGSLIRNHYYGVNIPLGEIGVQDNFGNQWLNAPSTGGKHAYNLNGFGLVTLKSKFKVGLCNSNFWPTSFYPNQPTCSINSNHWFNEGDQGQACPISFCAPLTFPKIPFGGGGGNNDYGINLTNDHLIAQRTDLNEGYGWESKSNLMLRLLTNSELLGIDPIIDSFYYSNVNDQLGKYVLLEKLLHYTNPINENVRNQFDANMNQINIKLKSLDSLQQLLLLAENEGDSMSIKMLKNINQNELFLLISNIYLVHNQAELNQITFLDSLTILNNSLNPSNIIQNNIKELNSIVLNTIARGINTFTPSQMINLFNLANQCSFIGGSSVGIARIMYNSQDTYEFNDSILCSTTQQLILNSEITNLYDFEVFPNPSKNGFILNIPENLKQQNLDFEIFSTNKLLNKFSLNFDDKSNYNYIIDTKNMQNGIYFLIIRDKQNILYSKKLILIH